MIGLPGCFQYVSVDFVIPLTNQGVSATWEIFVPEGLGLFGQTFFVQAVVVDPFVNAAGAIVTNAARGTIGM